MFMFETHLAMLIALRQNEEMQARRSMLKSVLECDDNELDEYIRTKQIYL
jgi:hypothetical protein